MDPLPSISEDYYLIAQQLTTYLYHDSESSAYQGWFS